MNRKFVVGIFLGIIVGATAMHFAALAQAGGAPSASEKGVNAGAPPDTGERLLPLNATLATFFTSPEAVKVISAPDSMTVHPSVAGGALEIMDAKFDEDGVQPGKEGGVLERSFQSLNCYLPTAPGGMHPQFLIRLGKGGHQVYVLVDRSFSQIAWAVDSAPGEDVPPVGLSDVGSHALRASLARLFPNESIFKQTAKR